MKIGFIGLGIMGKPMVRNLLKAGHEVVAYDIFPENVSISEKDGASPAASPADAARQAKLLITMLPNGPEVLEAVTGAGGILEGAAPGTVLADMSSIAPAVAKEVHAACAAKGVKFLDAPVSGGEPKAIDGTLSIMVGGCEQTFGEIREVLLCMGASAVLCGEIGAGNTTKLANQIIVAANIAACGEAFALAKQAGVDPAKVFDAIKGGLAGSTVMNAKVPMMLAGNYAPGFKIDLHIKDLTNALATAGEIGASTPLTDITIEMMRKLAADGHGQSDHSALALHYGGIANG
jgi:2-hydroxy-3-oxopropionate reductase